MTFRSCNYQKLTTFFLPKGKPRGTHNIKNETIESDKSMTM